MAIKVKNLKGIIVDIPDDWRGRKLDELIKQGYEVLKEEYKIPKLEPIKIEQGIKDPNEVAGIEVADIKEIEIPPNAQYVRYENHDGTLVKRGGIRKSKVQKSKVQKKGK